MARKSTERHRSSTRFHVVTTAACFNAETCPLQVCTRQESSLRPSGKVKYCGKCARYVLSDHVGHTRPPPRIMGRRFQVFQGADETQMIMRRFFRAHRDEDFSQIQYLTAKCTRLAHDKGKSQRSRRVQLTVNLLST